MQPAPAVHRRIVFCFLVWACGILALSFTAAHTAPSRAVIDKITILGARHIKPEVIKTKLAYKVGDYLDPSISGEAIRQLYSLGFFAHLQLNLVYKDSEHVHLYVLVRENPLLERVVFSGNKFFSDKKLREKLRLTFLDTISEERAQLMADQLRTMYQQEGYLHAEVTAELVTNPERADKMTLNIRVTEGPHSSITRVRFRGNKQLSSTTLRSHIFTRERWLLGFMDGAGKFDQAQLDLDKRRIESLYRNYGFINAHITSADVQYSPSKKEITVTFTIEEGDRYTIGSLHAPGDDIFLEEDLIPHISLEEGQLYNHESLIKSIENLKSLWGSKGYINADVYPQLIPNDAAQTVDITFHSDRGKQLHMNRLLITGNEATRDKVIRRRVDLEEGELLTTKKLKDAQDAIEHLSFFDRGGVSWRLHRISDTHADLEMNVKEVKTGNFSLNLAYGSDRSTPDRALRLGVQLSQRNFLGKAWAVGLNGQFQLSRTGTQTFEGTFLNPNLFDTRVSLGTSIFHRRVEYPEFVHVNRTPMTRETGGELRLGSFVAKISKYFEITGEGGIEFLNAYECQEAGNRAALCASGPNCTTLQKILNQDFRTGLYQWLGLECSYDTRNHLVYPNHGVRLSWANLAALPGFNNQYGFFKAEFEASYYTPIIGEDSLVLALHAKAGFIANITNKLSIPYKELYNIGGQDTVRGFTFGGIGPSWLGSDPLGAKNALIINAELVFPILPDFSMKGHVFYDGGAGWDTPLQCIEETDCIKRNKFRWRHAIGFGFNILRPTPAKIDWGYKIDRDKATGETASEFHVSMNAAW